MIRIAITKGRIENQVCKLLNDVGVDTKEIESKDRKLLINMKDEFSDIEFIFVKANDVLTFIKYGIADIGFVGKDTLVENQFCDYYEMLDLNVGKCYFALASFPEYKQRKFNRVKKIATKYPKVAEKYFSNKGEKVEIIKLEGSVELGPIVKISDAIIDIVETGKTLEANGLRVIEKIEDISTRLIVNKISLRDKNEEMFKIINKFEEVI